MIPDQSTLKRFLKARMNFFVYGPRASGKTHMLKNIFLQEKIQYIYINCTMGDKKTNFFRYLNHEMDKFFKKKIIEEAKSSKTLVQNYVKPSDPSSVHIWIQNIKNLSHSQKSYLQNIYFFIDNIQQIHLSANFITTFYSACQENQIQDFKIPFVFCGITLPKKIYAVDKPFRNIISFCMRKPVDLMKSIIQQTVHNLFISKFNEGNLKKDYSYEDVKKASFLLSNQFFHAFEPMQTDLNSIKKMTHVLADQIADRLRKQIFDEQQMKKKNIERKLEKRLHSQINRGQIKKYTRQMLEQGPIENFIMQRTVNNDLHNEQVQTELPYQYYPNLLLTSLHEADLYPQSQDKRRFQDYKKQKGRPHKNMENRMARHNLQRVIAISQAVQSIGKKDGPQYGLQHHSLNYYACLQFLREQGRIFLQGKNVSFATTKIHGQTKQQEARTFLKQKMDLTYQQFEIKGKN